MVTRTDGSTKYKSKTKKARPRHSHPPAGTAQRIEAIQSSPPRRRHVVLIASPDAAERHDVLQLQTRLMDDGTSAVGAVFARRGRLWSTLDAGWLQDNEAFRIVPAPRQRHRDEDWLGDEVREMRAELQREGVPA